MYDEEIRCPKCLELNDADKLAENTEYGCWSGPDVNVNCLHCEHEFEVSCEHAGYNPTSDFNCYAFMRAHKVQVPDDISRNFLTHYFEDLVDGHKITIIKSDKFPEYDKEWERAYHFSLKEWERIKADLGRE